MTRKPILHTGRLQVTRAGDGFVLAEGDQPDVFVPSRFLGSAVDGDTVVAQIERRPRRRGPEGRIVRVVERAWRQVAGIYHQESGRGLVISREPKLRLEFSVPPELAGGAKDGEMVLLEVVEWKDGGARPVGRVERILGPADAPGVDVLAILLGHQLPLEFPSGVSRRAAKVAERGLRADDLEGREDLRDRLTFTIDPPDARDHDDAVSIRGLQGGEVELGVHIADVSHYVASGGALDVEALERGTSVYLVDRVVPMLPEPLSAGLCSLVPREDRLTLSLLMRVDGRGEVRGSKLVRAVIRSRHRLSYDEAQAILDGGETEPELAEALARLNAVSRNLRRRRRERGSIDFDLPESRVVLNAAGEPTDIQRVLRLSSHLLIEDLMILANETVAALAIEHRLPFLFRVHESPSPEKIEQLRAVALTFGFRLPRRKIVPKDLARLVDAMAGTPQESLISMATLRSMQQARYATRNLGHFGLASPAYAHFTSPIRRYPDLWVHRRLTRWLQTPRLARRVDAGRLEEIARHCSERERRAVAAERDSVELKRIEFMQRHLGESFGGSISGVTSFGFFVLLNDFQVEGLVRVRALEDDYYVYKEERHALVGRRRRRVFQLGDPVRVRVARVDREERQIDFELVEDG
ncbi:MAG: ribonuclease R [Gemmatimonadota bacterium]